MYFAGVIDPMAKPTKKQQRHALKKQKARAEKRRALRSASARQADFPPFDFAPPPMGAPQDDEEALRASILEYVYERARGPELDRAIALFFGEKAARSRMSPNSEPEIAAFQEWYFFDFAPAGGERLIDRFARRVGPTLPPAQQAMLHSWIETNRLRLFEVQEVTPGVGEVVKDVLNGEVLQAYDITVSLKARKWQLVLARILRTNERWGFTGSGMFFAPDEKQRWERFLTERWQHYRAAHPEGAYSEFYRDHSLELFRFGQQVQEDMANLRYRSAEGHELVHASTTYSVLDYDQVAERLELAEEFVYAGASEEIRNADHYNWLLRGRSRAPGENAEKDGDRALRLRTEWSQGPGSPSFLSLGDLYIGPRMLRLDCLSRERLVLGRQLLEELLDGLITHQKDTFKVFVVDAVAPRRSLPLRERLTHDPAARQVELELLEREAERWLNTPVPALDNRSPLEAVQHPDGRAKVEEMLKTVEYYQDDRSTLKDSPLDVRNLRRALGLIE